MAIVVTPTIALIKVNSTIYVWSLGCTLYYVLFVCWGGGQDLRKVEIRTAGRFVVVEYIYIFFSEWGTRQLMRECSPGTL